MPLNIIKYNLFPVAGAGPELYGTEPWYFYLLNGLVNFNILLPLALLSLPAILVTLAIDPKRFGDACDIAQMQTHPAVSLAIRLVPFHLYLAVLTLQKHKEERFLYPAYAHLILCAAVSIHLARGWFEAAFLKVTSSPYRVGCKLRRALLVLQLTSLCAQATRTGVFSHATRAVIVLSCLLSFARISALHNHYHAPFNVFHHLQVYELPRLAVTVQPELAPEVDATLPHAEFAKSLERDRALPLDGLVPLDLRLCIGKEWHRYPSSWLVPDEVEPRFIKSAFDGILPKEWEAPGKGKGLFDRATATVPSGMNMYNREEADRYVRPKFRPFFL